MTFLGVVSWQFLCTMMPRLMRCHGHAPWGSMPRLMPTQTADHGVSPYHCAGCLSAVTVSVVCASLWRVAPGQHVLRARVFLHATGLNLKDEEEDEDEDDDEDEDEEDDELEEKVMNIAQAVLDELISFAPVVGPAKDAVRAWQDGRVRDYCFHAVMVICDLTPMVLASEAARMAKLSSRVAKLVRKGEKGYSLRKVAIAAKRLTKDAEKAQKLTPEIQRVLKLIYKVCVRVEKEASSDQSDKEKQKQ